VVSSSVRQPIGSGVKRSSRKRQLLIGGGAILLLLLGALGFIIWLNSYGKGTVAPKPKTATTVQSSNATKSVCSAELIGEANGPLNTSDQTALGPVVDKIMALKGFENDPNCMYVVLLYNIVAGDSSASSKYLAVYEKVFDPALGLSDSFTAPILSIETLRNNVAFLARSSKESEASSQLGDESLSKGSDAADKYYREHNKQ